MEPVNVRNLEQIQEQEARGSASRLGALILGSLATAAIVTAGVVMTRKAGPPAVSSADPLAALVASAQSEPPAERLDGQDVRFPGVLSDDNQPTTALAAVKDERGRLVVQPAPSAQAASAGPPPAMDRLPIVPLPVGTLLGATSVTTAPKDPLTAMAADASKVPDGTALAPAGSDGGFQLQVASFKDQGEADRLVEDLRQRGHRAFRQAAYVPARGLWHRVRIGPFKNRFEASRYKADFERNERMTPFLVDPEKVKQAEEQRSMRVAAEDKRKKKSAALIQPAE
jgi:cell division septation protein DedD